MRSLKKTSFIHAWVWSNRWSDCYLTRVHVMFFLNKFFSIKSHYERYNQLCLKPIIQFNLAWRCWDILRLEMAELFHNKVTRRVIREERKIIRHLKNMHAVVHMCTLWGVRAGVYTNQANRFPSNALFFYWKRLSEKALERTLSEWKYWHYAFTPPCHYGHDVKTRSQVWQVEEGLSNWDCSCEFTVIGNPVPGT